MASLNGTDRYDPSRDSFKFCNYCGQPTPVAGGLNSITIGLCNRHLDVFREDMAGGWQQNRLKELMNAHKGLTTT